MPPRRRPAPISSAAALPASRLPLGTPLITTSTSQGSAGSTGRSPPRLKRQATDCGSDKENVDSFIHSFTAVTKNQPTMAPNKAPDSMSVPSIAQAKLERQNKRNQELEAALIGSAPPEKRTNQPRGKKSKWQPLDLTEPNRSTPSSEGGVAVSEVRVNTFRASSRGSSLSRPVSVMSHRTSETGPSDMDRQDSALTEHGFQVFQRRRNRKNLGELDAYEDKPDERQTTVEATFDAREIYNVFGNALPGPGVMDGSEGHKDGEVRFVQHPNGDVFAHQWSAERFGWDNIGQFSNHRKKVEGQLAADRLKGETAHQSLQRNTLAYFRLIAKQREANVMSIPFGTKDIHAAIPEPQTELLAAPTGLKETTREVGVRETAQERAATDTSSWVQFDRRTTSECEPSASLPPPPPSRYDLYGPSSQRHIFKPGYVQYDGRHDDPFYSVNPYQQIYGSYPSYSTTYHHQPNASAQSTGPNQTSQRLYGLNRDFYFPQATAATRRLQTIDVTSPFHEVENFTKQGMEQWQQQTHGTQHLAAINQNRPQYHTTGTLVSSTSSEATTRPIVTQITTEALRPKPMTPLENRSAIRDHLWKQADAAKERSLSQGSILSRIVLYDPVQSQLSATKAQPTRNPVKQDISPTLNRHAPRKVSQAPPPPTGPSLSRLWSTPLLATHTPQITKHECPGTARQNLQDSSPDPYPTKQSYMYQAPIITTAPDSLATPQNFNGPFFTADSNVSSVPVDQKTYDEQLNDWWNSGKKFSRQEEFYRSATSSTTRKESTSTLNSSPAHLTPIGRPSRHLAATKASQDPSSSTDATRLLIPMLENLASYVQGPVEKRRDYFCQWTQPPEWCIDRSETGNHSFFDKHWGTPPARVGRDPRYNRSPWPDERTPLRGRYGGPGGVSLSASGGGGYVDRRFGFGGYYG